MQIFAIEVSRLIIGRWKFNFRFDAFERPAADLLPNTQSITAEQILLIDNVSKIKAVPVHLKLDLSDGKTSFGRAVLSDYHSSQSVVQCRFSGLMERAANK